jgi:tetratricopeptide (TPR) repeat protein
LISDKENSLIYYLISAIHYELEEYESSLKYIREALEFSDDHMIKHYFCKANTKAMLGRYDEAVKDFTNAVIVFKEQLKNDSPSQ